MKYRDSGMPEETYWETLFDVPLILERLGVDHSIAAAVELGCGHGTFTLPVAERISGILHTVDIEAEMVRRTEQRLLERGISNVRVSERDVVTDGFGVPPKTQDACLLFNILHGEEPIALLERAYETLKPGGRAYVIHWRYDSSTPRGPAMDIRPKPAQCLAWAETSGFRLRSEPAVDLPPYHWGMVLTA
jgi:SAM-dependent methyltransferase